MSTQYVIYNQENGMPEFYDTLEKAQARQTEFITLYPTYDTDLFGITVLIQNDDNTSTQYRIA
jgi:hypothetical protein